MSKLDFRRVQEPEPHVARTREIIVRHPEIRKLFGPTPSTSLYVFGLVLSQISAAYLLRDAPWWGILLGAYLFGAFVCHGLWALIHDCTHNLVFRSTAANSWLQILANLPHVFPAAMSFRKYHLLHHKYQGDLELDADLAAPFEAKFAGNSTFKKAFWLLFYFAFQTARIWRLKKIKPIDGWILTNLAASLAFDAAIVYFIGLPALAYLFLSSVFSVGLHPVGARWIQEHFMLTPTQETYSYYGILNLTAFNVGYHNEHHDFISVPWSRLPQIKALAPTYYESLHFHTSWSRLLVKFLIDPKLSLYSRTVREGDKVRAATLSKRNSVAPVHSEQPQASI